VEGEIVDKHRRADPDFHLGEWSFGAEFIIVGTPGLTGLFDDEQPGCIEISRQEFGRSAGYQIEVLAMPMRQIRLPGNDHIRLEWHR
jgi:hypothetical protein